jgi:arylsulfatase
MGNRMRQPGYYTAYQGKWHLTEEFDVEISEDMGLLSLEEFGFSDIHGIGDIIGMSLSGYQFDSLTSSSAVTWLRRQGEAFRQNE